MGSDKSENIRIRCREETKQEWAAWSSTFDTSEDALEALLKEQDTGYQDGPF